MASHITRILRIPFLVATAFIVSSCGIADTAGALFISDEDELQLGTEFDAQLRDSAQAFPRYNAGNNPNKLAFKAYIEELTRQIVDAIPDDQKPDYDFHVTILDQDVQNAFAVPGGYFYIYTGIIRTMRDESELAGVIGHEISHITRHHYRDAMVKQAGLGLLLSALLDDDAGAIKQMVAQGFFALASLKVSRDNESEADDHGTRALGMISRNPLGIAKFFSRQADAGFEWLSTHPAPPNRVQDIQAQVAASATLRALAADSAVTNYKSRFDSLTAVIRTP
jgi:predicted Zn-dependent protease